MMHSALRSTRSLVSVLALLLSAGALALPADGDGTFEPLAPLEIHPRTSVNVTEQLARHHYVRRKVDDELSSDVFDSYLAMLDPQRSYFMADEVRAFEKYRYALDDALRSGDLGPAFEIFNSYQSRLLERLQSSIELLENGISDWDLGVDEYLEADRSEAPWAQTPEALDELWRKRVKASVIAMRLNDKELDEISELLLKRYRNRLHRASQTNSEDAFQAYMNAVSSVYDPHTQYFSPRTSENFNINMSLSLEGIGAVLRSEDEYTSVVRLVPAGPADKSNQLAPSDRILGVAQEDSEEWVDVVGWRLDDVVDLIRGPAGSTVRLEILPSGSESAAASKRIALVREAVKLEEQSAHSEVLEIERNGETHRIGVIDVPTFYIDFKALQQGDPEYKSTTRDVARLIEGLKEQEVEGIVIDLRNNGGGSLQEANALTGLFIKAGPTVQIRSASGRVDLFNDEDGEVAWEGPLAVMVNRLSASASEIFAGAIQDYQRGLIIGSQTFGKGTVQTLIPLNRGQLKMTQAKFYRVSGQSTQHQGVIPDIEYPELYDREQIGESALDDALPWDVIRPTRFRRAASVAPLLSMLESRHSARVAQDPEFSYLDEMLARTRERNAETRISLDLSQRLREQEADEAWRLQLENRRRVALGKDPVESLDDLDEPDGAVADAGGGGPEAAVDLEREDPEAGDDEEGGSEVGVNDSSGAHGDDADGDALLTESGQILLDYITLVQSVAEVDEGRSSRERDVTN